MKFPIACNKKLKCHITLNFCNFFTYVGIIFSWCSSQPIFFIKILCSPKKFTDEDSSFVCIKQLK